MSKKTSVKEAPARKIPDKRACRFGCGKVALPGPITMHEKSCPLNPDPPPTIDQPFGVCKWGCGLETTAGALAAHELFGCPNREIGKLKGRKLCKHCKKVKTLPGPLALHEAACKG